MSARSAQPTLNLPGDESPLFWTPGSHGLIETTSNFGYGPATDCGDADCARRPAVLTMPTTMLSLTAIRLIMMRRAPQPPYQDGIKTELQSVCEKAEVDPIVWTKFR